VFEDQRGHAGDDCGDLRALHARHAGRRRCSRNVVIIWPFRFAIRHAEHEPSTADPRAKRLDSARMAAETAATSLDKASAPAIRRKTV
jgi:hypothetical protein